VPITRCVIPAAGLGTRFLPATKSMPKEMLPTLDRPVIQYVVEEALSADLTQILLITGRGKRAIEDHFDHSAELESALSKSAQREHLNNLEDLAERASIHYVRQRHQRGLADAVYHARHFVGDEPFIVLLGDTIFTDPSAGSPLAGRSCTRQLVEAFEAVENPVISVERVRRAKIRDYGIVKLGKKVPIKLAESRAAYGSRLHLVADLVEKPEPQDAPSDLGIVGAYALTPDIFEAIEKTPPGKNGEVQLTDALRILLKKRPIFAFEFDGRRLDIGTKQDWLRANLILGLESEPWRTTIAEVMREHPEGRRLSGSKSPTRRDALFKSVKGRPRIPRR
jgi:UTP--glucose-1-phosphate uridylyltransferase